MSKFKPGDLVASRDKATWAGTGEGGVGLVLEVMGRSARVLWSKRPSSTTMRGWCALSSLRRMEDGDG